MQTNKSMAGFGNELNHSALSDDHSANSSTKFGARSEERKGDYPEVLPTFGGATKEIDFKQVKQQHDELVIDEICN